MRRSEFLRGMCALPAAALAGGMAGEAGVIDDLPHPSPAMRDAVEPWTFQTAGIGGILSDRNVTGQRIAALWYPPRVLALSADLLENVSWVCATRRDVLRFAVSNCDVEYRLEAHDRASDVFYATRQRVLQWTTP